MSDINYKEFMESVKHLLESFDINEEFLSQWIEYIKGKDERFTGYLIREAVLIYSGTKGLLSFAKEISEVIKTVNLDSEASNKYENWCTKLASSIGSLNEAFNRSELAIN